MTGAARASVTGLALAALLLAAPPVVAQGLAVERVTILANGARSDAVSGEESAARCHRFRLRPDEVRAFFARAGRVDARAFHHDLNMSRCHARGRLRLADGRRGEWFIDLERRGSLTLAGVPPRYVFCLDCTSRKFEMLDAEDREAGLATIRAFARPR